MFEIGDIVGGRTIEQVENSGSLQLLQLRDEAGRTWGYSINGGESVIGFNARHEAYAAAQEQLAAILEARK